MLLAMRRVGKYLVILATHFSVLDNSVKVFKASREDKKKITPCLIYMNTNKNATVAESSAGL